MINITHDVFLLGDLPSLKVDMSFSKQNYILLKNFENQTMKYSTNFKEGVTLFPLLREHRVNNNQPWTCFLQHNAERYVIGIVRKWQSPCFELIHHLVMKKGVIIFYVHPYARKVIERMQCAVHCSALYLQTQESNWVRWGWVYKKKSFFSTARLLACQSRTQVILSQEEE